MTSADDVNNIILGAGGSAVTVYTEIVERVYTKLLTPITPPQSSANWASGVKDTKIVDLLRVTQRMIVTGMIESTDEAGIIALNNGGGVFNMTWDGTNYNINIDKLTVTKSTRNGEQSKLAVSFTALVGVDI